VRDLYHEDNTPHRGPYFTRPDQFRKEFTGINPGVMSDLDKPALMALRMKGLYRENTPTSSPISMKHDTLLSCGTASIDIQTMEQPDEYGFIFHDEVLERIKRQLRFPIDGDLRPDRTFGVRYKRTNTARIFLVEADMGTEVMHGYSNSRKTIEHNLHQYDLLLNGEYKQYFPSNTRIVVVFLVLTQGRMASMLELAQKTLSRTAAPFVLFKTVPEFAQFLEPPPILDYLFHEPYARAGLAPFDIREP